MALLHINSVSKFLANTCIVNNISFEQDCFQKIAIAGETGSGKSTLLKMIAGFEQPDTGNILFEGKRVKGPEERLIPGHPDIAYLSQHFELRNSYRVEELLSYANKLSEDAANALFEICRINHLVKRKTDQLSGGERQRIAIARLLIASPKLLLLDEPYTNLDLIHKNILKSVIRDIGLELQITCLMVSHDPMDILSWADEIMLMKDGEIIQRGNPEQVYHQPKNEYAAAILGNYQLLPGNLATLFAEMAGISFMDENVYVRSEYFKIVSESDGIKAVVNQVFFMAGVYEIEILIAENNITIKTMESNLVKGDTVFVALDRIPFTFN